MAELNNKDLFLRKIQEYSERIEDDAEAYGVSEDFIHITIIGLLDEDAAEEGMVNMKAYFVFNVFDETELESILNRAKDVYTSSKDQGLDFDDLFDGNGISLN